MYLLCHTVVINQEGTISERLCTGIVLLCPFFYMCFMCLFPFYTARACASSIFHHVCPSCESSNDWDGQHTHTHTAFIQMEHGRTRFNPVHCKSTKKNNHLRREWTHSCNRTARLRRASTFISTTKVLCSWRNHLSLSSHFCFSFTQDNNGLIMALPTDQIKSAFLLYNGSLIPATGAILFVLFCQGKTLGRVKLIFFFWKAGFLLLFICFSRW